MFHFGILASLVGVVSAVTVVGPVADLPIVNKVIAPDGFPRSLVLSPSPVVEHAKCDPQYCARRRSFPCSPHHGVLRKISFINGNTKSNAQITE